MDIMGIAGSIQQSGIMQQVGVEMLDMAMEQEEVASASMIKMMEQSVQPNLGSNFDVSV
jgi:hypothetical protein